MSSMAILFKHLFSVCRNGAVPNLKLVGALMNVHKAGAIYHHSENVLNWCPAASGKIRMGAKHWRDLASDEEKLEVCLRKALGLQTANRLGHFSQDFRIFWNFRMYYKS